MDEMRIGQLTKEMVAEELRRLGDPSIKIGALVRQTVRVALSTRPKGTEPAQLIEDTVKGAMTAILLADQSLVRGSLQVLEAVIDVAAEFAIDPTEAMRAGLKGLADIRRFVDPSRVDEVHVEIEAKYMGAGEVFNEFLREPIPGGHVVPRRLTF
jgi:hypothetical protein